MPITVLDTTKGKPAGHRQHATALIRRPSSHRPPRDFHLGVASKNSSSMSMPNSLRPSRTLAGPIRPPLRSSSNLEGEIPRYLAASLRESPRLRKSQSTRGTMLPTSYSRQCSGPSQVALVTEAVLWWACSVAIMDGSRPPNIRCRLDRAPASANDGAPRNRICHAIPSPVHLLCAWM